MAKDYEHYAVPADGKVPHKGFHCGLKNDKRHVDIPFRRNCNKPTIMRRTYSNTNLNTVKTYIPIR